MGYALEVPTEKVGDFDTELVEEFLLGFARSLGCAVHVRRLAGTNSHHIIEGMFKRNGEHQRKGDDLEDEFQNDADGSLVFHQEGTQFLCLLYTSGTSFRK